MKLKGLQRRYKYFLPVFLLNQFILCDFQLFFLRISSETKIGLLLNLNIQFILIVPINQRDFLLTFFCKQSLCFEVSFIREDEENNGSLNSVERLFLATNT